MPKVDYPDHFEKRLVSRNGGIRWRSQWVNVSHVLAEEHVGLEEVDEGRWDVYFGHVRLGQFDERTFTIKDALGRRTRRRSV